MQESIMHQGVDLMLYGMGSVFVFLTVLVIATTIMSSLIQRFLPDAPATAPAPAAVPSAPTSVTDPKLLAVIKAAVDQHRAKNQ